MTSERKDFLYKTHKALFIQKKIDTLTKFKMRNFCTYRISLKKNYCKLIRKRGTDNIKSGQKT